MKLTPVEIWKKIHINEHTFCFSIFVTCLSIVLGKICIRCLDKEQSSKVADTWFGGHLPDLSWLHLNNFQTTHLSYSNDVDPEKFTNQKFVNASSRYDENVTNNVFKIVEEYNWAIKISISSIFLIAWSWYIIYMDSSIPGVDPPAPFNLDRIHAGSRIQINYLMGLFNGILIAIYISL